jgi:hypothetical protein
MGPNDQKLAMPDTEQRSQNRRDPGIGSGGWLALVFTSISNRNLVVDGPIAWERNPDNPQENSSHKNPILLAATEAPKPPTLNNEPSGNCARKAKKSKEKQWTRPKRWTQ